MDPGLLGRADIASCRENKERYELWLGKSYKLSKEMIASGERKVGYFAE